MNVHLPADSSDKMLRAFAARLKSLMAEQRRTRQWLARTAGIPHTVLTRYFGAKQLPPQADMQKLADALEVPVEQLQAYMVEVDYYTDPEASRRPEDVFKIVAINRRADLVMVQMNYIVSLDTAIKIGQLISQEEHRFQDETTARQEESRRAVDKARDEGYF